MKQFLSNGRLALAATGALLLLLCFWYYPGEAPSGDAAYKYLQTRDFIRSGGAGFACEYPGRALDPTFRWFPFQEPMAYVIGENCFYVFPFQLVFVFAPFYLGLGNFGFYLVSVLSAWGILLVTFFLGGRLGLDENKRSYLVWFSFSAYGLVPYALGMNEFALTGLLALVAVYLALGTGTVSAALGGLCVGIALQFRVESALLGCTIPAAMALTGAGGRWRRAVVFGAIFAVCFIFFIYANYAVFGHPLGLRGIVFMEGQAGSATDRLLRLFRYWIGQPTAVFVNTPVFILFVPVLWLLARRRARNPGLALLALVALSYGLVVPLLVANYPGAQFGERFLFNVYPLFAVLAFFAFELEIPGARWRGRIAAVALAGTVLYTGVYLRFAYGVDRAFHETSRVLEAGARGSQAVVFRNHAMVNGAFAHFYERPQFLAVEDVEFSGLVDRLRAMGIRTIVVGHSAPQFRAEFKMHAEITPPGFTFKSRSADLGNEFIELRRFEL